MKISSKPETAKFEVTWKNEDGSTLRTDFVEERTLPVYKGLEPTQNHVNEKKKYVFNGWTPEITQVDGDKIYTASYIEVDNAFNVSFALKGGHWDLENTQTVLFNDLITKEIPIKDGYTFTGWETEGIIFTSKFDSNTPIQKDYALVATWVDFKHTVTFDLDGGKWSMDNIHYVTPGEPITTNKPTKEHYVFIAWLYNNQPFDSTTPIKEDINLKAQWEAFDYEALLTGKWIA